jgi:hypothetical protein
VTQIQPLVLFPPTPSFFFLFLIALLIVVVPLTGVSFLLLFVLQDGDLLHEIDVPCN